MPAAAGPGCAEAPEYCACALSWCSEGCDVWLSAGGSSWTCAETGRPFSISAMVPRSSAIKCSGRLPFSFDSRSSRPFSSTCSLSRSACARARWPSSGFATTGACSVCSAGNAVSASTISSATLLSGAAPGSDLGERSKAPWDELVLFMCTMPGKLAICCPPGAPSTSELLSGLCRLLGSFAAVPLEGSLQRDGRFCCRGAAVLERVSVEEESDLARMSSLPLPAKHNVSICECRVKASLLRASRLPRLVPAAHAGRCAKLSTPVALCH